MGPGEAQVPTTLRQFCKVKGGRCRKDKELVQDHRAGRSQTILVSDRLSLPCLLPGSYGPSLQGLARAWSPRAADLP